MLVTFSSLIDTPFNSIVSFRTNLTACFSENVSQPRFCVCFPRVRIWVSTNAQKIGFIFTRIVDCKQRRSFVRFCDSSLYLSVFSHTVETLTKKKTRILSLAVQGEMSHITRTTRREVKLNLHLRNLKTLSRVDYYYN